MADSSARYLAWFERHLLESVTLSVARMRKDLREELPDLGGRIVASFPADSTLGSHFRNVTRVQIPNSVYRTHTCSLAEV